MFTNIFLTGCPQGQGGEGQTNADSCRQGEGGRGGARRQKSLKMCQHPLWMAPDLTIPKCTIY